MAQTVKNPPTMQETRVRSLGWEDPLEEGMATHSTILDWRIQWTEWATVHRGHKELDTSEQLPHTLEWHMVAVYANYTIVMHTVYTFIYCIYILYIQYYIYSIYCYVYSIHNDTGSTCSQYCYVDCKSPDEWHYLLK